MMFEEADGWARYIATDPETDAGLWRHWSDEMSVRATVGVRLAPALLHGTDHRSQARTALTLAGDEPPQVDVWAHGEGVGRVEGIRAGG
jgi:uncharacterized damage-inducible protein DinB